MNKGDYFVLLSTQKGGGLVPMTNDDGVLERFTTFRLAELAAQSTVLGASFGYLIFNLEDER